MVSSVTRRLFSVAATILLAACGAQANAPLSTGIPFSAGIPPQDTLTQSSTEISASNVASYHGCPVFTSGDYYNKPIAYSALDAHSAEYISGAVHAGNTYGFYASTGAEKVNLADATTPMVDVHPMVSYHPFPADYPWHSTFFIEPQSDEHAIVVSTASCHLYEAYRTDYDYGALSAFAGANWNLRDDFVPLPPGTPSAMASGLPLFAGMVKWEDYQSGAIRHALNWAPPQGTASRWNFVRPASDTGGSIAFRGTTRYQIPFGAHLRLRASFSTSEFGPQARMVANAMKTYGVYLADVGSAGNALYFANAPNGSNPWSARDLAALSKIHLSDFVLLQLPAVQTVGH